jgi:hypothetical protein
MHREQDRLHTAASDGQLKSEMSHPSEHAGATGQSTHCDFGCKAKGPVPPQRARMRDGTEHTLQLQMSSTKGLKVPTYNVVPTPG